MARKHCNAFRWADEDHGDEESLGSSFHNSSLEDKVEF